MNVGEFRQKFEEENRKVVEEFLPISAQGMQVVERMIQDYNKPYRDLLEKLLEKGQFFHFNIELDSMIGVEIHEEIKRLLK